MSTVDSITYNNLATSESNITAKLSLTAVARFREGGGGGTTDHSQLTHLAYDQSGHTGFARAVEYIQISAGSSGTLTPAVLTLLTKDDSYCIIHDDLFYRLSYKDTLVRKYVASIPNKISTITITLASGAYVCSDASLTSNHNELNNLSYENSGHTGFAGIKYDTSAGWSAKGTTIPAKGNILVYTDYKTISGGINVCGIKVADGVSTVSSLSFITGYLEEKLASLENNKQDKLTAGENIKIENNIISALSQKMGRNFTTDVTVGNLASGTAITSDMTIADVLYRILVNTVIHVTGISLNKTSTTITVGNSETLVATITPPNATDKQVIWTSSSSTIATVNQSGVVTALTAGTTTITATSHDGGFTAQCAVTVQPVPVITYDVYMGGAGNDDEQEEPSEADLAGMTHTQLSAESALIGQHAWHLVVGNVGQYSQYPAFVVPNTYEVTAWSTDPEGAYPVSSIQHIALSENRTMYYAPDPIYDFPEGADHYITVVKK